VLDRPAGSWIVGRDGALTPNFDDEAMKNRQTSVPQAGLDEQAQRAFDERPSGLDAESLKRSAPRVRDSERSSSEAIINDKEDTDNA
jgi:hypothetical protein